MKVFRRFLNIERDSPALVALIIPAARGSLDRKINEGNMRNIVR